MPYTVVIAELKQETNTSAAPTTLKDFEDFHLFFDDQIKIGLIYFSLIVYLMMYAL
jgi:hypothetical protein